MGDTGEALRSRWIAEQLTQSSSANFTDDLSFTVSRSPTARAQSPESSDPLRPTVHHAPPTGLTFEGLRTVGGLDISFRPDSDGTEGVATLVVLSWPSLAVLQELSQRVPLSEPYIPSFLSFRESTPLAALVQAYHDCLLPSQEAERIQLLWVDGNGRLHEREAGSAVVVGLKTGVPTIGIGKEYHPAGPLSPPSSSTAPSLDLPYPLSFRSTQKGMKKACQSLLQNRGDWISLHGTQSPAVPIGAALLASPVKGATNAIFVSPGHKISLGTSVEMTLEACKEARVPEPVRMADALSRAEVVRIWGSA